MFGPWDPATFEVEDSAFCYIQMENGQCFSKVLIIVNYIKLEN
jgi:hypothetical protein